MTLVSFAIMLSATVSQASASPCVKGPQALEGGGRLRKDRKYTPNADVTTFRYFLTTAQRSSAFRVQASFVCI